MQPVKQNWNLQDHFGHVKFLTMNPSSERSMRGKEELAKVGMEPGSYEVVLGVDGSTLNKSLWERMVSSDIRNGTCPTQFIERRKMGQMGCFLAHYNLIKATCAQYKLAV